MGQEGGDGKKMTSAFINDDLTYAHPKGHDDMKSSNKNHIIETG